MIMEESFPKKENQHPFQTSAQNCMQLLKTNMRFLTDIRSMVAFFLEGILNQHSL